jgi:putative solute:sodium symporter small subunit
MLVDVLNAIKIGGYKLGFWFAQQGSIYSFVILIYVYAKQMAALDRKYNVDE